jgi:hypothetical protein
MFRGDPRGDIKVASDPFTKRIFQIIFLLVERYHKGNEPQLNRNNLLPQIFQQSRLNNI